ncbi:hypothetical protein QTP88_026915 [Uroleucon formosanum]
MLKTVSLLREMNRDFEYNEDISQNEHGFEDDQVHIDEENSGNISKCSNENNNTINEQENDNNPETLPLIINDLGAAVKTSEVLRELHNDNNIDPVIIEQPSILSNHIEDNEVDDLELELRTAAADRCSGSVSRQEQVVLDIQNIWTKLKKKYPLMYEWIWFHRFGAMVALVLPTTQVTVERLFSSFKFILNDQRNRINPSLLEDIIVVRSNYLFDRS